MTRAAGRILVLLLAGTTACTPVDDEPPVGLDSPDPTPAPPSGDPGDWPGSAAACGLEATYESAYFLEGSFVDFDVHCTGDLGDEDALLSALRLPPGASFDEDSQRVTWSTGLDDAGSFELVFAVRSAAQPDAVPQAESIPLSIVDDPFADGAVPPDPMDYEHEWGLPVFHVQTDGGLSQSYVGAEVSFQGRSYDASIKIRGASSTGYPKNSFTMEFDAEELQVEPWGVTRDHLILLTTFDDNSYVRQKLVYDQWAAIAEYWDVPRLTPRTFFAVLYLNGNYHGLYVALDRIDNEFLDQMGFERDANLYKAVNHDANFSLVRANGSAKGSMHDGLTKEEGLPEGDFSDVDALVWFTGNASAEELIAGADEWIDLQEFMDWFLLVHYSESGDSAGKNSYLYNDPTNQGFHFAPWDFNHSWGQGWYTYRISSDTLHSFDGRNRVFWAIHSVPEADDELWERFSSMRADGPFALDWMLDQVDGYYELIDRSAARDWQRWGDAYFSYGSWAGNRTNNGDWTDYEAERDYLYEWIEDRDALFWVNHPEL